MAGSGVRETGAPPTLGFSGWVISVKMAVGPRSGQLRVAGGCGVPWRARGQYPPTGRLVPTQLTAHHFLDGVSVAAESVEAVRSVLCLALEFECRMRRHRP